MKPLLHELKEKGIWLSKKLIDKILTLANEKQEWKQLLQHQLLGFENDYTIYFNEQ